MLMGRATGRSVRFGGGNVSLHGFWLHGGGLGGQVPPVLVCGRNQAAVPRPLSKKNCRSIMSGLRSLYT